MEASWEDFHLDMDLDCGDDYFIDNINIDGDDFLREILLEIPQSSDSVVSESEQQHQQEQEQSKNVTGRCYLPKTFILSFDDSTMIPATREACVDLEGKRDSKNKRKRESGEKSEKMKRNEEKVVKRGRNSSQCVDHIIAERKRRQELTEKFIALSATIPGLSKTDKASILRAAIDYVKHLQQRVHDLEKQDKNVGVTSNMVLDKPNLYGIIDNNEDKNFGQTSSDDDDHDDCNNNNNNNNNILPEIEARVMGKEVLVEIHCEKQIGIELKVLKHIENLELFVTGSSVLSFGKSDLSITIIAQMGEGYKVRVEDLVKSVRRVILKPEIGCEVDLF
ncbi:transcription factor bHLH18-like [Vicia villosa]|uniref:transcription factor bHLH18-like n=1 Tax=Vicia villosa TaxID=3911 RepID=UPI00273AA0AA|nr:transcription factor bHLH18-like [Vicia villosa]